jgi:hypothetical protein
MPNMKISELIINKDVKFQENEKQIIPHFEYEKKLLSKLIHNLIHIRFSHDRRQYVSNPLHIIPLTHRRSVLVFLTIEGFYYFLGIQHL